MFIVYGYIKSKLAQWNSSKHLNYLVISQRNNLDLSVITL